MAARRRQRSDDKGDQEPRNRKDRRTGQSSQGQSSQGEAKQPSPARRAAEEAVQQAEAQLEAAQAELERIESEEEPSTYREPTLGQFIDQTLKLVQRYPGAGVLLSAAVGFLIGRTAKR